MASELDSYIQSFEQKYGSFSQSDHCNSRPDMNSAASWSEDPMPTLKEYLGKTQMPRELLPRIPPSPVPPVSMARRFPMPSPSDRIVHLTRRLRQEYKDELRAHRPPPPIQQTNVRKFSPSKRIAKLIAWRSLKSSPSSSLSMYPRGEVFQSSRRLASWHADNGDHSGSTTTDYDESSLSSSFTLKDKSSSQTNEIHFKNTIRREKAATDKTSSQNRSNCDVDVSTETGAIYGDGNLPNSSHPEEKHPEFENRLSETTTTVPSIALNTFEKMPDGSEFESRSNNVKQQSTLMEEKCLSRKKLNQLQQSGEAGEILMPQKDISEEMVHTEILDILQSLDISPSLSTTGNKEENVDKKASAKEQVVEFKKAVKRKDTRRKDDEPGNSFTSNRGKPIAFQKPPQSTFAQNPDDTSWRIDHQKNCINCQRELNSEQDESIKDADFVSVPCYSKAKAKFMISLTDEEDLSNDENSDSTLSTTTLLSARVMSNLCTLPKVTAKAADVDQGRSTHQDNRKFRRKNRRNKEFGPAKSSYRNRPKFVSFTPSPLRHMQKRDLVTSPEHPFPEARVLLDQDATLNKSLRTSLVYIREITRMLGH
eukprot:jgi/Bigna1/135220/aug1.28_g9928